jgi:hypothetical protein
VMEKRRGGEPDLPRAPRGAHPISFERPSRPGK